MLRGELPSAGPTALKSIDNRRLSIFASKQEFSTCSNTDVSQTMVDEVARDKVGTTVGLSSLDEDDAELVTFTEPQVLCGVAQRRSPRVPPIVCPQSGLTASTAFSSSTVFRLSPLPTRRSDASESSRCSGSPLSSSASPRHPTASRPMSPTDEMHRLPCGGLRRQSLTPRKIWNQQQQQLLQATSPPVTARSVFAPQSIVASSLESSGSQPWQHAVLEACVAFSSQSIKRTGRI